MKKLTEFKEWLALSHHHEEIAGQHMRDWFTQDKQRFQDFHLQSGDIMLDYSRNRITHQTMKLLCQLAQAVHLPEKMEAQFTGQMINTTENRPALHTALRDQSHAPIFVNNENMTPKIMDSMQKLRDFVTQIHNHTWTGITGKPISHVVNIGIGGSHLGPMMCTNALKDFAVSSLKIHYISSVDDHQVNEVLQQIDPESTLFIISSKSFTTIETLTNTRTVLAFMEEKLGFDAIKKHFIAVTAADTKARALGIPQENIFPLWEWVGGRYSIWSAVGLPLMLMIGNEHFADFLQGAYEMDQHFRQADFSRNMPVILAMLDIWYVNFFGATAQAIVPYIHRLRYLVPYLQQAEMESNGKSIDATGHRIHYPTSPVIFGEEGCSGQHTYHQLLHQGSHFIPVDFILASTPHTFGKNIHQDLLIASCLSQAQALMRGKTYDETYAELVAAKLPPDIAAELAHHQMIAGNKPSNTLILKQMNPKNLGALIALYEHKIFVQGVVWDINSFDQWGVELGKQLLPGVLKYIECEQADDNIDSATMGIIHHLSHLHS